MFDVTAIGELLIDFTPAGPAWTYKANPGGSVSNVLAQLALLGRRTAFMGKIGRDKFGGLLRQTLEDLSVDTSGLQVHPEIPTTLAFVHIDSSGDRSFTFYRNPGADMLFTPEELDDSLINSCAYFHFAGVSLTKDPMRRATLLAVQKAKAKGKWITFDPNYRASLWESEAEAIEQFRRSLPLCDVLKVSEEEAEMITGTTNREDAATLLLGQGPTLVFITMGAKGCSCYHQNLRQHFPTYDTAVVDTTGSGDSFFGAVLHKLLQFRVPVSSLTACQLGELTQFGNASGASCATKYGAIPALPNLEEIESCMASTPLLLG